MSLQPILDVVYQPHSDTWAAAARDAIEGLTAGEGSRYPTRAAATVMVRAPEMRDSGIPFAALIHPSNPTSGPYGGMSFVLFPTVDGRCMIALVVGTQGLSPDEEVLGRPGHARKAQAICTWLNRLSAQAGFRAWAKPDPTRTDQTAPPTVEQQFSEYASVFSRYGHVLYALYCPDDNRERTYDALAAFLDLMFAERRVEPLAAERRHAQAIRSQWMAHLLPPLHESAIIQNLERRRFVILAGPPGTGKTRAALRILHDHYQGHGTSIQFHPNTTYENFIGGLAPIQTAGSLGLVFAPQAGDLMLAAQRAREDPSRQYLLHIDEINRADLAKVLGEAIMLLEPRSEEPRRVRLPYSFEEIGGCAFDLPENLHILGTMNTSDRSIAIVDVAVRRRFAFLSMWPDITVVREHAGERMRGAYESLLLLFMEYATDDAFDLLPGHSYFLESDDDAATQTLKVTLAPLLQEYLAQGYVVGFSSAIQAYLQWIESL